METVIQVAKEIEAQIENLSVAELSVILMQYGQPVKGMTRDEMIKQIVDLEVHAFTH